MSLIRYRHNIAKENPPAHSRRKRGAIVAATMLAPFAVALGVLLFGSGSAGATPTCSIYWTGKSSTAWETKANWSFTDGGAAATRTPNSTDYVCMSTAPTTANVDYTGTPASVTVVGLNWPTVGSVSPVLNLTNGTFTSGAGTTPPGSTVASLSVTGTTLIPKGALSTSNLNFAYGTVDGPAR